ncbi:MAG TPA: hypothetical protein ENK51_10520 [Gammaproteobacteria bacterium]|nr:hypothetical protein [Gammaproteobacteria bacterium]
MALLLLLVGVESAVAWPPRIVRRMANYHAQGKYVERIGPAAAQSPRKTVGFFYNTGVAQDQKSPPANDKADSKGKFPERHKNCLLIKN